MQLDCTYIEIIDAGFCGPQIFSRQTLVAVPQVSGIPPVKIKVSYAYRSDVGVFVFLFDAFEQVYISHNL